MSLEKEETTEEGAEEITSKNIWEMLSQEQQKNAFFFF